jgi:hypothetical protein
LGQWFICIKLFYSLKFPVRYTDIIVEGVILLYLFLPMFYVIVSAHKVAVLTLASKNSGYLYDAANIRNPINMLLVL